MGRQINIPFIQVLYNVTADPKTGITVEFVSSASEPSGHLPSVKVSWGTDLRKQLWFSLDDDQGTLSLTADFNTWGTQYADMVSFTEAFGLAYQVV